MKNVIAIMRKIVLSYIILYGYNLIAVNFNMVIPINLITVTSITLLGAPTLLALILLKIIIL